MELSDIHAEKALIGAMMLHNGLIGAVVEEVSSEDFSENIHSVIFGWIADAHQAGNPADPSTLGHAADSHAGLSQLGGRKYLAELIVLAADTRSAPVLAREIRKLAMRRRLLGITTSAAEHVKSSGDLDVEDIVSDLETQISDVIDARRQSGPAHISVAVETAVEMMQSAYQAGARAGTSTGIASLDDLIGGLHKTDLVIIAGRPAMGKSAFALHLARSAATAGQAVGIFSLEMSADQLATRMVSSLCQSINPDAIRRGEISTHDAEDFVRASHEISALPIHIDDTGSLSVSALASRARRMKTRNNIGLLIVDYLQLLTTGSRNANRVQEVSEITRALKGLAKSLSIPVVALSQLSRSVDGRANKRPMLSDLRESGSIEQDADIVMFLYREEYYLDMARPGEMDGSDYDEWLSRLEQCNGIAEIIVAKNRHGRTGTASASFSASRGTFR